MKGDYLFLTMAMSSLLEPRRSLDYFTEASRSSVRVISINDQSHGNNGISDNFGKSSRIDRKFYLPYQRRG